MSFGHFDRPSATLRVSSISGVIKTCYHFSPVSLNRPVSVTVDAASDKMLCQFWVVLIQIPDCNRAMNLLLQINSSSF